MVAENSLKMNPGSGGDCGSVQNLLVDVRRIYKSRSAFAAVTGSGAVILDTC